MARRPSSASTAGAAGPPAVRRRDGVVVVDRQRARAGRDRAPPRGRRCAVCANPRSRPCGREHAPGDGRARLGGNRALEPGGRGPRAGLAYRLTIVTTVEIEGLRARPAFNTVRDRRPSTPTSAPTARPASRRSRCRSTRPTGRRVRLRPGRPHPLRRPDRAADRARAGRAAAAAPARLPRLRHRRRLQRRLRRSDLPDQRPRPRPLPVRQQRPTGARRAAAAARARQPVGRRREPDADRLRHPLDRPDRRQHLPHDRHRDHHPHQTLASRAPVSCWTATRSTRRG